MASGVKDIAELSDFLGPEERAYAEQYIQPDDHNFRSLRGVSEGVFSKSDIEALNFAWDRFNGFDEFALSEITHKYPEWEKHRVALQTSSRIVMDYEDFFDDPAEDFEKCFELTVEQRRIRIESLKESSRLEKAWNC